MAQVDAGMRVARSQVRPFLLSQGQFVAWCKQSGGALGITVEQMIAEYWDWRTVRSNSPPESNSLGRSRSCTTSASNCATAA
jgi:DNA primase